MIDVSVLIPAYNAQATLANALDSCLAQTMGTFEVLVIDDGSADATQAIAKQYANKDSRIKLIALEKNGGVSRARNAGLSAAQGQWIAVLDADDWMIPTRLERLTQAAQALDADIVFDNLNITDPHTKKILWTSSFGADGAVFALDAEELFERDTPYSRLAIGYAQPLFKTAFLREKGLAYDETLSLGEDFMFLARALLEGAQTFALPFAGYYYAQKSPSQNGASAYTRMDNKYEQVLAAGESLLHAYDRRISVRTRRAIERRQRLFLCLDRIRQTKLLIRRGNYRDAARFFLECPVCFGFLLKMVSHRLFNKAALLLVLLE